MVKDILLIFGGVSGEHDVSCISAQFLEKTLKSCLYNVIPVYVDQKGIWYKQSSASAKPDTQESAICRLVKEEKCSLKLSNNQFNIDFVFPIIHGTTGEDGKLQGLLEFLDIPYAGAGVLSSALCMDKFFSKTCFIQAGIPQVKFIKIDRHEWINSPDSIRNSIKNKFIYPVFIKPANMGSSVGVTRVNQNSTLNKAIELAFAYDNQILCEQGIDAREIEISILGNYPDYKVSIPGEIIPNHEFYSYEAKYLDENGAKLFIPAEIQESQITEIQNMAKEAFKAVTGDGFARIDFFLDKVTKKIYLNEINTLPGFTPISMFPKMWEASGMKPAELLTAIVNLGVEKFQGKKTLKTHRSM